jgi:3-hydroxyisobutyrate dehydrogenase-like beta-hydroxyacid dehydrogenase
MLPNSPQVREVVLGSNGVFGSKDRRCRQRQCRHNQIIVALNIAAMSESMLFATKSGVNPSKVYEAIRGGLAGVPCLMPKCRWYWTEILNLVLR